MHMLYFVISLQGGVLKCWKIIKNEWNIKEAKLEKNYKIGNSTCLGIFFRKSCLSPFLISELRYLCWMDAEGVALRVLNTYIPWLYSNLHFHFKKLSVSRRKKIIVNTQKCTLWMFTLLFFFQNALPQCVIFYNSFEINNFHLVTDYGEPSMLLFSTQFCFLHQCPI